MTDPISEFHRRWTEIASNDSVPLEERWQKLGDEAVNALNALRGDSEALLAAVGARDANVYQVVADAIDAYAEYPYPVPEDLRAGALGLVPVFVTHTGDASSLPRQIGAGQWSPPLPNGEPVPALTDFLLAWEEVIEPKTVTKLHESFRRANPARRIESLTSALGKTAPASGLDGLRLVRNRRSSLRFLPFYLFDDQPVDRWPPFESEARMESWRKSAHERARASCKPPIDVIQAFEPMTYRAALWKALDALIMQSLEILMPDVAGATAPSTESPPRDDRLLIEAVGSQAAAIASGFRLSLLDDSSEGGHDTPPASFFSMNWHARWASWKMVAKLIETYAGRRYGLSSVTAPLVQDAGAVFMARGAPRILLVLGPSEAFEPQEPDGLAVESAGNPDHEHARFWQLEREQTDAAAVSIRRSFAEAAGIAEEALGVAPTFVIRFAGWRPAFSVFALATPDDSASSDPLLGEDELRAVVAGLGGELGRKWLYAEQSGSGSGFRIP